MPADRIRSGSADDTHCDQLVIDRNGDGTASKEDKEESIEDQEEKEKSKEAMEKEMGQDCNTQ